MNRERFRDGEFSGNISARREAEDVNDLALGRPADAFRWCKSAKIRF